MAAVKYIAFVFLLVCFISTNAQQASATKTSQTISSDVDNEIELKVVFEAKDNMYVVKLQGQSLFYFYIISNEPIPELEDQDLFINMVDSENHGWPVIEAGYIDTRYGVKEFAFDLNGKNFYLLGTNGEAYSKVNNYDFHK